MRSIKSGRGARPCDAAATDLKGAVLQPGPMEVTSVPERDFLSTIRERVVVYDGGMGATLEQFDLTSEDYGGLEGKCHEALVLNRPDVIEGVHAEMAQAGAMVVETDTFQASRLKLEEWGLGAHTLGRITFRELVTVFEEQARGLVEGGADLLIIETAQDILEVKAAVFGAREAFKALGRAVTLQTS